MEDSRSGVIASSDSAMKENFKKGGSKRITAVDNAMMAS